MCAGLRENTDCKYWAAVLSLAELTFSDMLCIRDLHKTSFAIVLSRMSNLNLILESTVANSLSAVRSEVASMVLVLNFYFFRAPDGLLSSDNQKVKADWWNWKDCSMAVTWLQWWAVYCVYCTIQCAPFVRNFRVLHCMLLLSISEEFFFFFCKFALQQYSVEFIDLLCICLAFSDFAWGL